MNKAASRKIGKFPAITLLYSTPSSFCKTALHFAKNFARICNRTGVFGEIQFRRQKTFKFCAKNVNLLRQLLRDYKRKAIF